MKTDLTNYFSRFGFVESVKILTKGDFSFAFVQFKSENEAKAALSSSQQQINNQAVTVRAAKSKGQSNTNRYGNGDAYNPHDFYDPILYELEMERECSDILLAQEERLALSELECAEVYDALRDDYDDYDYDYY